MKKLIVILTVSLWIYACNPHADTNQALQIRIDSLHNNVYKPGLGEFMSGIQVHHAKLWFAGQNKNWPLADFEINEIKESLGDIQQYCTDRPEVKSIGMINAPIDSISNAIKQKNPALFKSNFTLLTATCNNCHKATNHAFNVIKIPDTPPFTNQDFKAVDVQ